MELPELERKQFYLILIRKEGFCVKNILQLGSLPFGTSNIA